MVVTVHLMVMSGGGNNEDDDGGQGMNGGDGDD